MSYSINSVPVDSPVARVPRLRGRPTGSLGQPPTLVIGAVAAILLLAGTAARARAASGDEPAAAAQAANINVVDLSGRSISFAELAAAGGRQATVFIFLRTDCPISNRYAPEIKRLEKEFPQVTFWLVFVDPDEPPEAIRRYLNAYGYHLKVLRDPTHALVRLTGVRVTPEAAVFVPGGPAAKMVYRGRIDDKYVDFGKERIQPTTHDLEQVLKAIAAKQPVASRTTPAVGCFISDLEP
jgi:hypothetical protein